MSIGWTCPNCGAGLAPSVTVCPYCDPTRPLVSGTTLIGGRDICPQCGGDRAARRLSGCPPEFHYGVYWP
jgi:RNA polymerase subunit RPABC4/transcription elongation factor Spt4